MDCLILCLFKIYDRYENTQRILEGTVDFSMAYEEAKRYSYEYHEGSGISGTEEFAPEQSKTLSKSLQKRDHPSKKYLHTNFAQLLAQICIEKQKTFTLSPMF